jgi:tetratricopeptide (TPR) repeat protein
LATDQSDEDMLLVVADSYLRNNKNPDKVLAYSTKMVEVMTAKPKPEGVSDADWDKRKTLVIGLGHYMSGKIYMNQQKFPQADKELRDALPLIGNNKDLKAETTFLLGFANYRMKKIPDAIKYNQMCAEISSPYQAQAQKNIQAMRAGK